jgi:hypothetical protein
MAQDTLAPAEDKKLLKTLGSFTRDELGRFRDYILSSYLSNKGPLLEFLDVLLPMISKGKTPTAAQMLKLLLKTARLSRATYRNLFADLSKLVQGFLQNERYADKPEQAVSDVLTAVNAKRLNKLFDINISLARRLQSNVSNRSAEFYLREFVIATENDFHKALARAGRDKETPERMMEQLDEFYITNKLRYSCEDRHFQQYANKEEGDMQIAGFMALIDEGRYEQRISIQVYAAIYKMLNEEDVEEHFGRLKELLKLHQKELPEVILRDAYVFAINYCVRKVNKGKFNYLRDVYELYKIALDKKFLYDENELSPWDYSNIMALGVQLRDYKWSEKIIEVYKERIPTAGKKMNVITFNMAKMYFFSGRYKDVLQLLEGVKSDELMYILGVNTLLIKTYYEMGEKEELYRHLAAFKLNLKRRRKIGAAERKSYLQFIDYATQLSELPRREKKALKALKQAIDAQPDTAESEWLLERV